MDAEDTFQGQKSGKGERKGARERERESAPENINAVRSGDGWEISSSHVQLPSRTECIPFNFHSFVPQSTYELYVRSLDALYVDVVYVQFLNGS